MLSGLSNSEAHLIFKTLPYPFLSKTTAMDAQARSQLSVFQDEDWMTHGYTEPLRDKLSGSPLTEPVNKIFSYLLDQPAPATPNGPRNRWGQLSPEEYDVLRPTLRLASRFIQSDMAIDCLYHITHAKRFFPQDGPKHKGLPVFCFRRGQENNHTKRTEAMYALAGLAGSFQFMATERDSGTPLDRDTHGRTSPLTVFYPNGVRILRNQRVKGLASVCKINHRYLKTLQDLLQHKAQNKFKILKLQFELAVTLTHELAHAINCAIDGGLRREYQRMGVSLTPVDSNEPLFDNQRVAELGFFLENEIFGGCIQQSLDEPNRPVLICEWPSFLLRDASMDPERTGPAPLSTQYLVSAYYIQNIQSQEFWTWRKLQDVDTFSFRIRKTVGCRHRYAGADADPSWGPDTSEDDRWPTAAGTPRVVRNGGDPSLIALKANEPL